MNATHPEGTPRHVAIIMDGNGRWAQQRGQERLFGHIEGRESVRRAIKAAIQNGVRYLTLYTFSTENWGRPQEEVDGLMELLCESCIAETPELQKQGVKMLYIGDRSALSEKVQTAMRHSETLTEQNDRLTLVMAVNYSARWEITRMAQRLCKEVSAGRLQADAITPEVIADHLATAGIPDPDLLIRTGGEHRLSNFLLWQLSYSELYFTDTFWPDFDQQAFDLALADFRGRQRRYGLLTK